MQEGGEALYLRVAPTVICAFAYVIYSDIDVLTETPYGILVFCVVVVIIEMMLLAVFCVVEVVMMLLRVLVWLRDTFLELSREMSRKIVKNSGNIARMLDPRAYYSRCHCQGKN
ncbi:hypothetical protein CIPAW_11G086800 [Carya illinoinensis]|uniref:Uncharacterized protein n=1 Tax=Carya illinoinensis TaxID=32201 RepID=A0A8T1P5E3_CARIL|nr:hypothetical protein CIPAW_11G086800 [Carya illinoinensis]